MPRTVVLKRNDPILGKSLRYFVGFCLLVLASFFPTSLSSHTVSGQEPESNVDVLSFSTDLILFPIRVADKRRRAIPPLTAKDFLFKDNDEVMTEPYFSLGAERVAMVFALDESGSLRDIIADQRETAVALFGRFKGESRIAVLRFAEKPNLIVGFDRESERASEAFKFMAGPNRRTAIFDAAVAAAKTFDNLRKDPAERRIVILISDGLDNASGVKAAAAIAAAQERNVSFYVIHLPLFEPRGDRLAVRAPTKGFRELAEKTGGRYFLAGDAKLALSPQPRDLAPLFKAIEEDLKSQYLLGFYVGEKARDGRLHRVSITLSPAGLVYSIADRGFERTHHFSVNRPRNDAKPTP